MRPPKTDREKQDALLVQSTWDACRLLLPEPLATSIKPSDAPAVLFKKGGRLDIVCIHLLPSKKKPSHFWDRTWCFYEIGIGRYDGDGLCLGGVQFLQFAGIRNRDREPLGF